MSAAAPNPSWLDLGDLPQRPQAASHCFSGRVSDVPGMNPCATKCLARPLPRRLARSVRKKGASALPAARSPAASDLPKNGLPPLDQAEEKGSREVGCVTDAVSAPYRAHAPTPRVCGRIVFRLRVLGSKRAVSAGNAGRRPRFSYPRSSRFGHASNPEALRTPCRDVDGLGALGRARNELRLQHRGRMKRRNRVFHQQG
jgi:hypothetical protein